MAFLDNSGDIVLDAVLTKAGREKLSRGMSLDIRAYALGDDEINYSSYDIAHPSGSAYYDLEVLQTPVLESITGRPAGINHGLLKMVGVDDLLYLPVMNINTFDLITTVSEVDMSLFGVSRTWKPYRGVFNMMIDSPTVDAFVAAMVASPRELPSEITGDFNRSLWNAHTPAGNVAGIFLESGLDTTDVPKTLAARNDFVVSNNLATTRYYFDVDRRLFNQALVPEILDGGVGAHVLHDQDPATGEYAFAGKMNRVPLGSTDYGRPEVFNYTRTNLPSRGTIGMNSTDGGVTPSVTSFTTIAGPNADHTCFVPLPDTSRLGTSEVDSLWTDLGKKVAGSVLIEGSTGTFASKQFYFIDTIVYVHHSATNVGTQFTIRLIKLAA